MKKINRLFFFVLIMVLTATMTITVTASEKKLIEQSLQYLEQHDYNMAIDLLEEALLSIREKAQLELMNVQFTEDKAAGFGMYQKRKDTNFAQGETFYIYAEPKNFSIKENEQGLFESHFKQDLYLTDMEGDILWGKKGYLDFHLLSHNPNREINITNTVTQDSPFPKGEYQFQMVVTDVLSQKTVEQSIGFIVE
jgi:hypothetical protein